MGSEAFWQKRKKIANAPAGNQTWILKQTRLVLWLVLYLCSTINNSFSPCAIHNGDRDGSPGRSGFSQWAFDNAYVVKSRQKRIKL